MQALDQTDKSALLNELRSLYHGSAPQHLLRTFIQRFPGRLVLASSMAVEDQVLTDMIVEIDPSVSIITLDTGRLPQETHETIEATQKHYDIDIQVLTPDSAQVEAMVREYGANLFYDSVENRKRCCHVRKIEPLNRGLKDKDVWVCGLRKEQSVTRTDLEPIAWDEQFGLIKLSPLLDWTTEQVWDYVRKHDVPYNSLHDKGYPSIGCAPCTRPVAEGEDIRAGRWWWERPEHKECGLHWNNK